MLLQASESLRTTWRLGEIENLYIIFASGVEWRGMASLDSCNFRERFRFSIMERSVLICIHFM